MSFDWTEKNIKFICFKGEGVPFRNCIFWKVFNCLINRKVPWKIVIYSTIKYTLREN